MNKQKCRIFKRPITTPNPIPPTRFPRKLRHKPANKRKAYYHAHFSCRVLHADIQALIPVTNNPQPVDDNETACRGINTPGGSLGIYPAMVRFAGGTVLRPEGRSIACSAVFISRGGFLCFRVASHLSIQLIDI
ncbi:MAG: hypothetical protein L6Q97_15065 [Thermoanaerobaculia bacterium]|nr:hypothetical protein [Thermoanaerobaculia bacterium]